MIIILEVCTLYDSMTNKNDKLHAEDFFFYLNRDYANMQFSVEKVVKNLTAAILSNKGRPCSMQ